MTTPDDLNGLILAGGESKRMGYKKAIINYHGVPQMSHLFHLLSKHCQKVFTSCKHAEGFVEKFNPLPDKFDIDTPLNGILSAFQQHPDKAWLSVPVDMPYIDDDLLNHLITHRDPEKSATCYYDSSGKKPEPLLCIWETKIIETLQSFYQVGGVSPRQLLQKADVNFLEIPDKKYLLNINTPEELAAFQKSQLK